MGYTEISLQEHVAAEHTETSTEVICPICAALPGGDPNHVTDDFAAHLTLEHRAPRDLISFLMSVSVSHAVVHWQLAFNIGIAAYVKYCSTSSGVRHVRRMFHPGRGLGGPRGRRSNMHFTSTTTGGLSSNQSSSQSSTYSREAMDPIAELLSQLSGVRRSAGGQLSSGPSASQLQQLQMQLQLERQQAQAARQQLETARNATRGGGGRTNAVLNTNSAGGNPGNSANPNPGPNPGPPEPSVLHTTHSSQFLLSRLSEPRLSEAERQACEAQWADRSLFVTELLLSTLLPDQSASASSEEEDEDDDGRHHRHRHHRHAGGGGGPLRNFSDFQAMGCVEVMTLDVALENLNLKETAPAAATKTSKSTTKTTATKKEPPAPPL
ncbi:E3 ubiquitin-protein ligase KCMF1 [Merluccius polli]|uniref:RING-type E3 ubiquitin transferase n=1 Tax=Merluccius polli TaxID=89951 RepID=A0AA47M8E5_MERPO|nr:E3 ubiquitin-protein ligase KCMF1 [Merluccius polli]